MSPRRSVRHAQQVRQRHSLHRRRVYYHRRLRLEALEDRSLLAPFTPGDFVALRVGPNVNPNTALTSAATPVFIDEIDSGGNVVQSIPLPTTVNGNQGRLTQSGLNTTEGMLTRSADGRYLVLAGYDASPGTSISTVNRVVGRIDTLGNTDTTTVVSDGYTGSAIRGAATVDGTSFWTSGGISGGGVRFMPLGNTGATTLISTTSGDTRDIQIIGGQLYVTANPTSGVRLAKVGTGTPPRRAN